MAENRTPTRPATDESFVPSMVDRLVAPESFGSGPSLGYRLPEIVESVRRDLEDLLNTRQTHQGMSEEFVELHDSILAYGLPDFTTLDGVRTVLGRKIGLLVEGIVNRFEPRLREVRAIPVETASPTTGLLSVRIHIEAKLRIEPFPDLSFDSVIELTTGKTSISSGDH